MNKVMHIVGARPNFMKIAPIIREMAGHTDAFEQVLVHTGQHYDENMSEVFFDELQIPRPNYNLQTGSGNHGKQTAAMLEGIEAIILNEKPDAVLVYGDTNSTVAGGLAASKLLVPLIHIEAGLRSFNKKMPEEINRIACDHMSTLLFSPTKQGAENLKKEGFQLDNAAPYTIDNPRVYHCGDIMYDNSLYFSDLASNRSILKELQLEPGFILSTIHRNNNTDDPGRLTAIFEALISITAEHNVQLVLPIHPRTRKMMDVNLAADLLKRLQENERIKIIPPVSFLDVIALEKNAGMIVTDSGGVQKEAFFFQKPCIILRPETEWVEIVTNGNAILCDADKDRILEAYNTLKDQTSLTYPPLFGDGKAAAFICSEILKHIP